MEKNYKMSQFFLLKMGMILLVQSLLLNVANGQAVAIVGLNTDTPDQFALVALVDITDDPANKIFFTDMSYDAGTNTFTGLDINGNPSANEGVVKVTWTGTWTKGTIINVEETGTSSFTVTAGPGGPANTNATIVYAGDGFSLSGSEGFSVFISDNDVDPATNIKEIYGYITLASSTNDPNPANDPDCPCSPDFVNIDFGSGSVDGIHYTPGLRGNPTDLATYNNPANWTTSSIHFPIDETAFTNITFGSNLSLPVELTSFSAQVEKEAVVLKWATASEKNNDYFSVEKSTDGERFESIAKVSGAGSSFTPNDYVLVDNRPYNGLSYYRLKQVDFNGDFEYSNVIAVRYGKEESTFSMFPNPANAVLNVEISDAAVVENNSAVSVQIFSATSQMMKELYLGNGFSGTTSFDISDLPRGIYFVNVRMGTQLKVEKLVIR